MCEVYIRNSENQPPDQAIEVSQVCSSGAAASCSRDEEDDVLRMTRGLRAFRGAAAQPAAFGTSPLLMDDAAAPYLPL